MPKTINLLYEKRYEINDDISIQIPTVGDILKCEDEYYELVSVLTSMPIDYMVQLDDVGVDFTSINDYELFMMLFPGIKDKDTSMVFGNLDLSKFSPAINEKNGAMVLVDHENDIVIDRAIYGKIAATLRKIHHLEANLKKPANKEAREYLIQRARIKMARNKNKKTTSNLESLIISLVNTEQFKYDFERTRELSIYQFNESVRQIIKKIDYEHRMSGVYAGTINAKELPKEDLTWLMNK